ncbi:MAG: glutamate 5-kinase, partial [Clostridia bacterium]|nr:glutamate 5-kinase [Clostridia bacterium]
MKKLIVVKAGTTSLTGPAGDIDREKIKEIVRQLSALKKEGHSVALVSSGAIAAGFRAL